MFANRVCFVCWLTLPVAALVVSCVYLSEAGEIDGITNDIFILRTDPKRYNKWLPPQKQQPIMVNVSIFLFGLANILESQTEFDLQVLLRTSWYDERLDLWSFHNPNISILEGGAWHLDRLWVPSLHVPNSKIPNVLQDKSQNPVLTRIQSNGMVLVSKRINLQGMSLMDFRLYPLDEQKIKFQLESNELSQENLELNWATHIPCSVSSDFVWNGYTMTKQELTKTNASYTHTGVFSKVIAVFHLRRTFSQFFLDLYVPVSMFVIVSWGSFWIEITAAPARVTLGVTVMLTMVTTARSAREKLPPVSYIHAMDIWITVCVFFVFAVIIEYTAVNYIYFRLKRYQLKKVKRWKSMRRRTNKYSSAKHNGSSSSLGELELRRNTEFNAGKPDVPSLASSLHNSRERLADSQPSFYLQMDDTEEEKPQVALRMWLCLVRLVKHVGGKDKNPKRQPDGCEEIAYEIDRISRIAFPSLFLVFNIGYWLVLVILSSQQG